MRNRKIAKCPNCCPDGGAYLYAEMNYDGDLPVAVWVCSNCHHETPRRTNKRPTEDSALTPSQIRAITQIQQYQLQNWRDYNYEVKKFSVSQLGHKAFVSVVVGKANDSGTMAAILCRYHGLFTVGRGGKIEAVNASDENKSKAKEYPLIYGWSH